MTSSREERIQTQESPSNPGRSKPPCGTAAKPAYTLSPSSEATKAAINAVQTSGRRDVADMAERDSPGVIAPPPLIYASGLVVGLGLGAVWRRLSLPTRVAGPVGAALIVAGLGLAASFVSAFHRAHTPVDPRQATTAIVTTGPYRLSRNPGYLGMALIYSGIAMFTSGLWAFLTLVPTLILVDRGVIAREERYLERKFGAEYLGYKARTRRWL